MITNAEIEGFIFGMPEGTISAERIERARATYCQPDTDTSPYCGDHLTSIRECGCKL